MLFCAWNFAFFTGGPPFSKSGYDLTPLTPDEVGSMVDKLTELQKVVLTQASEKQAVGGVRVEGAEWREACTAVSCKRPPRRVFKKRMRPQGQRQRSGLGMYACSRAWQHMSLGGASCDDALAVLCISPNVKYAREQVLVYFFWPCFKLGHQFRP